MHQMITGVLRKFAFKKIRNLTIQVTLSAKKEKLTKWKSVSFQTNGKPLSILMTQKSKFYLLYFFWTGYRTEIFYLMMQGSILKRSKMERPSFISFSRVQGAINLHTCNPIPVCKRSCKQDHTRNTTIHRYMPCCLIQAITSSWMPALSSL